MRRFILLALIFTQPLAAADWKQAAGPNGDFASEGEAPARRSADPTVLLSMFCCEFTEKHRDNLSSIEIIPRY
jgi:hypothetical protein